MFGEIAVRPLALRALNVGDLWSCRHDRRLKPAPHATSADNDMARSSPSIGN
jgi:hypothetical protein